MSAEDDLIARFFAPIAGEGALGLRDDAGLLSPPMGHQIVVTMDALVAGVHFFPDDPPASVAVKALGVNLSDLAAKAARPLGFLLTLALPRSSDAAWLDAFAASLGVAAARLECPLVGGDTVSTPGPLTLSITAFGTVPAGAMLPRTGARAGDLIYVSGTVGDGALGLAVRQAELGIGAAPPWVEGLEASHRAHLRDRYLEPQPRVALRPALRFAHAGMDVSDGLVGDLAKMLQVSGVSGRLDAERVPLSPAAVAVLALDQKLLERVLTGGDDYEVLATVAEHRAALFEAAAAEAGVAVTRIGLVTAGAEPLTVRAADGSAMVFAHPSFSHL